MSHTLYIDRNPSSIENVFTLIDSDAVDPLPFIRLPGRSGQRGFEATSWIRGKSPIPFGQWLMSTKPIPLQMEPKGTPFFPICSNKADPRVIKELGGRNIRMDIGLHFENRFPGSIGCQVAIPNKQSMALFDYLEALHRVEPWIRVVVL